MTSTISPYACAASLARLDGCAERVSKGAPGQDLG